MSRAARGEFEGAIYYVMCRGVARMPVFYGDEDRLQFLSGVGELIEQGDLAVYAFCLMPNHYIFFAGRHAAGSHDGCDTSMGPRERTVS